MLRESKSQKNGIKDTGNIPVLYETSNLIVGSYNKTNKLITALYMITDIMDKEEPLRNKLRNLAVDIVSDIYLLKGQVNFFDKINNKISEILSFLEIASEIGIASEMNCSIITKEFNELRNSIIELASNDNQKWLEEFIKEPGRNSLSIDASGDKNLKTNSTRIGVQKGSTLLKALSDRIPDLSKKNNVLDNGFSNKRNNNEQKNKRREEIIRVIKDKVKTNTNFDGISIKDIVLALRSPARPAGGLGEDKGEKTLQRELVSMVSEGILKKIGEKRWSKYNLGSRL